MLQLTNCLYSGMKEILNISVVSENKEVHFQVQELLFSKQIGCIRQSMGNVTRKIGWDPS